MASFRPRTLTEYLHALWSRRGLFLFVVSVMLISTLLALQTIPDFYQSSASVIVAGEQEDRQVVATRVAMLTQKIDSWSFLEPLIQRHSLYPAATARGAMESAINRMRDDIKVEAKYRAQNPELVTISYNHTDPTTAREVATDLVSAFTDMNTQIEQQRDEQAKANESEMAEIEKRMDELASRRVASAARSRAASRIQGSLSGLRAQRLAAASSVADLSDKQYALEQQIAQQKQLIGEQEKIVKSAPSDARAGSSYGVLLVRKAELEAQLKDYSSQYTEKNPKVLQTRTQLEQINKEIAQVGGADSQSGASATSAEARELRGMQRELSRMEIQLEVVKREMARKGQSPDGAPSVAAVAVPSMPSVAADVPIENIAAENSEQRLQDRYDLLLKRQDALESMKYSSAGMEPGVFQVVEMPVQPQIAAGPNRLKLRMLAVALALAVGLVVVGAVEIPRLFIISDERDVEYFLNAPVIALIPETLTSAEQGRTRRVLLTRGLAVLLLGAVLVPACIFLLNQLKILQILANR